MYFEPISTFSPFDLSKRKIITSAYEWRKAHQIIVQKKEQTLLLASVSDFVHPIGQPSDVRYANKNLRVTLILYFLYFL